LHDGDEEHCAMPNPNVTDQERKRRAALRQACNHYLCSLSEAELHEQAERLLAQPIPRLTDEQLAYALDIAVEDLPAYRRAAGAQDLDQLNELAQVWAPKAQAGNPDAITAMRAIAALKRRLIGNRN
jgi:hypothetical protein